MSIRLEREEYEELLRFSIAEGADSISEIVRRAMKLLMERTNIEAAAAAPERP